MASLEGGPQSPSRRLVGDRGSSKLSLPSVSGQKLVFRRNRKRKRAEIRPVTDTSSCARRQRTSGGQTGKSEAGPPAGVPAKDQSRPLLSIIMKARSKFRALVRRRFPRGEKGSPPGSADSPERPRRNRAPPAGKAAATAAAPPPSANPNASGARTRWVLTPGAGSTREGGKVVPSDYLRQIRGRIAAVLRGLVDRAVAGDVEAADLIGFKVFNGLAAEYAKHTPEAGKRCAEWERFLTTCFSIFMGHLHTKAQRVYDSEALYRTKWMNCLPMFQAQLGVSSAGLGPYINVTENVTKLKELYTYFYFLHLDSYCRDQWPQRYKAKFPRKSKYLDETSLNLKTIDVYEDYV